MIEKKAVGSPWWPSRGKPEGTVRELHRFFVPEHRVHRHYLVVSGEDVRHLVRVLRLGPGDRFLACSGSQEMIAEIERVDRGEVRARIVSRRPSLADPPVTVTLVQGLPKGEKMDLIIQKCTEIGVGRIIPVITERCVVRWDAVKAGARRTRWEKIAREAAEQCGRGSAPRVGEVTGLREALEQVAASDLCLLAWEGERGSGLKETLRKNPAAREVALLVGPEGGFGPGEVEMAFRAGFQPVSLGPRVLRTETAGPAALAMILYELGDLGGYTPEARAGAGGEEA